MIKKIDQLEPGMEDITVDLYLTKIEEKEKRNGDPFLILFFQDSVGRIEGRKWKTSLDNIPVDEDGIVCVKGDVVEYKGRPQLKVKEIWDLPERDKSEFVESVDTDPEKHFEQIKEIFNNLSNDEQVNGMVNHFLDRWEDEVKTYPAASGYHHAKIGGLSQHVYSMLRLGVDVVTHYKNLYGENRFNMDLLMAGIILHDLGKIYEFDSPITREYGERKDKEGHISMIIDDINEYKFKNDLPQETYQELKHIILSHHGKQEWGSPVEPQTPEAKLVHRLDMMDSRMAMVYENI